MELYIDTSNKLKTIIGLESDGKPVVQIELENNFDQAEKLLPNIDQILQGQQLTKKDLSAIFVKSQGDSFTSLRVGIITANALAFGLKIPVRDFEGNQVDFGDFGIVRPEYSMEPNITVKKNKPV